METETIARAIKEWLLNEKLLGKNTIELESELAGKIMKFRGQVNAGYKITDFALQKRREINSRATFQNIQNLIKNCKKCELWKTRKNVVFGSGNFESRLLFIGEAPGATEDAKGLPFVGEAGKLLTQLIESIGLKREEVYITNVIKCRPPGNRDPLPIEIERCEHWLKNQLILMKPEIICTLGRHSTYALLGGDKRFAELRGKIHEYKFVGAPPLAGRVIKVIPTYHPAALLYHPGWKPFAESDFKLISRMLSGGAGSPDRRIYGEG